MRLDRREIARILREISTLLQIKGENPFKSRAYDIAAQRLEGLTDKELEEYATEGRLTELPGIGEAIAKKISELFHTGTLPYYEQLRGDFPPRLRELMTVPGLGPKKIAQLHQELGVGSIEDLKKACEAGRVRGLKGFTAKGEAALLEGIAAAERMRSERRPLAVVRPIAEGLLA
ncbi:MAG: helix-hairpin-helix domain-containing protein, partial [Myxococcales bacterium]